MNTTICPDCTQPLEFHPDAKAPYMQCASAFCGWDRPATAEEIAANATPPAIEKPHNGLAYGFHNIHVDKYHSQELLTAPALTSSTCKTLVLQSPRHAHYLHPKLGKGEKNTTAAMNEGTVGHKLMLGKGRDIVLLPFDTYKTNAAKDARDAAIADGCVPCLEDKYKEAEAMAAAFEQQVRESDKDFGVRSFYDENADSEVVGICDIGGVLCQIMLDRVIAPYGEIYDIKVTTTAQIKALTNKILNMGYDIQDEFYVRGFESLIPQMAGRVSFTFLFIESTPPYAMTPVRLDGSGRALARAKVDHGIEIWRKCLRTRKWPAYSTSVVDIETPAWAVNEVDALYA